MNCCSSSAVCKKGECSNSMVPPPRIPDKRGNDAFSPGLQALMQWIAEGESKGGPVRPVSTGQQGQPHEHVQESHHRAGKNGRVSQHTLSALANTIAIRNAVRLQPLGYKPGVMSGCVGLLEGLRKRDMEKYDEAAKPQKRRAPPADLSGLSAEEIVARRNWLAREYSMAAHERREAAVQMLEQDAVALRVAREVIENAPPGVAYLMLSADMRGLVLYANANACEFLRAQSTELLGRPFAEIVHPTDLPSWCDHQAVLVLSKSPHYSSMLRFRVCARVRSRTGEYRLVDSRFRFGAFGVACSLWVVD